MDRVNSAITPKTLHQDGMIIDIDVAIPMPDGIILRADVFRPEKPGKYPVILSYGPYAKGLSFQEGYKSNWSRMVESFPEILANSSNKYQVWELVDPEKWVPDGFICLRIDSRGAGRSPGVMEVWSPIETRDMYDCVEWAAVQEWSNGRIGINGISYFAMNQWWVAGLQPPHLAAICVWEGAADYYRDLSHHGGIMCDFLDTWFKRQCVSVQHGVGDNGKRSPITGDTVAGPTTLTEEQLRQKGGVQQTGGGDGEGQKEGQRLKRALGVRLDAQGPETLARHRLQSAPGNEILHRHKSFSRPTRPSPPHGVQDSPGLTSSTPGAGAPPASHPLSGIPARHSDDRRAHSPGISGQLSDKPRQTNYCHSSNFPPTAPHHHCFDFLGRKFGVGHQSFLSIIDNN